MEKSGQPHQMKPELLSNLNCTGFVLLFWKPSYLIGYLNSPVFIHYIVIKNRTFLSLQVKLLLHLHYLRRLMPSAFYSFAESF